MSKGNWQLSILTKIVIRFKGSLLERILAFLMERVDNSDIVAQIFQ